MIGWCTYKHHYFPQRYAEHIYAHNPSDNDNNDNDNIDNVIKALI